MTRVSVIIPCLNEEATIAKLLEALYAQSYPRAELEVVIADGLSTDGTRERIAAFAASHPDLPVAIVDNPSRRIPTGLNLAMKAAKGGILLRLDAHCVPQPDYIARSVEALEEGLGANVGGVWEIQPGGSSWMARAIAQAAAHPFGVGDARYRLDASRAQAVDTVPFGAFKRALIDEIGPFDESLGSNEDYEFNHRIRLAGRRVWLDPAIRSTYFARPRLGALMRQYARYGYWKWRMLRRYPRSLRWRQLLPPVFVLSLMLLPILAIWWPWLGKLWGVEVVSYALLLLGAGAQKGIQMKEARMIVGLPLAIGAMHLSWGLAFLFSTVRHGPREA